MSTVVEVSTGSRLHFGMFSFGRSNVRQFGGVGTMIEKPGLELQITEAPQFATDGPLANRVNKVVRRISEQTCSGRLPRCRIEVVQSPPEHLGLGTGTQLELAVAAGLNAFRGNQPLTATELALLTGRGFRSAVGTYGFLQGGLIVESGKLSGDILAPLEHRVSLPAEWRIVLIFPNAQPGLAGEAERRAFRQLPCVPSEVTSQLRAEVDDRLLPAVEERDFEAFGESLYRFGHLAGTCFAQHQGGPFASDRVAQLVGLIREWGIRGAGQSSWGPTVFALLESDKAAEQFTSELRQELEAQESFLVTRPTSEGARIARQFSP